MRLNHGGLGTWQTGGCGAKLEREVLADLLRGALDGGDADDTVRFADLDDAAEFALPGGDTVLTSLDFAPPISRDPVLAGAVASVNALNDIWACGGKALLAMSILGMPKDAELESFQQLLRASSRTCRRVGAALVGGHTIRSSEPLFGLAVVGLSDPRQRWMLSGAVPGDALILTKALGAGLLISAARRDPAAEAELGAHAQPLTLDHAAAVEALAGEPVHAATDVSGFGLAAHAANLAEGSRVGLRIDAAAVPVFEASRGLAEQGYETSITAANMRDPRARFASASVPLRRILCDPQTAGPLLLATAADSASRVVELLRQVGYPAACVIGEAVESAAFPVTVHGA
jgi:selenide, water dikinase